MTCGNISPHLQSRSSPPSTSAGHTAPPLPPSLSRDPYAFPLPPPIRTHCVTHATHPLPFASVYERTPLYRGAMAQDEGTGLVSFFESKSLFSFSFNRLNRHRKCAAACVRHWAHTEDEPLGSSQRGQEIHVSSHRDKYGDGSEQGDRGRRQGYTLKLKKGKRYIPPLPCFLHLPLLKSLSLLFPLSMSCISL